MTLVSVCAPKGSPGVTTLASVLAASAASIPSAAPVRANSCLAGRVVLVEADPSGSDLTTRFALNPNSGLIDFLLSRRASGNSSHRDPSEIGAFQMLPGGLEVLTGPIVADGAGAVDREIPEVLGSLIDTYGNLVFDCGRILPGAPGQACILSKSDMVLLLVRSDGEAFVHCKSSLDYLAGCSRPDAVRMVILGKSRNRNAEVAAALGFDRYFNWPVDVKGAALICGAAGSARRLARSTLVKSGISLCMALGFPATDLPDQAGAFPKGRDNRDVAARQSFLERSLAESDVPGEGSPLSQDERLISMLVADHPQNPANSNEYETQWCSLNPEVSVADSDERLPDSNGLGVSAMAPVGIAMQRSRIVLSGRRIQVDSATREAIKEPR